MKKSRLKAAAAVALRCKLPIVGGALVGVTVLAFGGTAIAVPTPVGLGTATNDAVLSGASPTNAGAPPPGVSTITGDVVSNNPSQPGFTPCVATIPPNLPPCVVYTAGSVQHAADGVATQNQNDSTAAYVHTAGLGGAPTVPQLGGQNLVAGVYAVGAANITGSLTLNAAFDPSSVWIFNASSIQTATNSNVVFTNIPAGTTPDQLACNVFWTATSSANLLGTTFVGTIMAQTSITVGSGVTVNGRLLAQSGNVTLINDTITRPSCVVLPAGTGGTPAGSGGGTVATPATGTGGGTGGGSAVNFATVATPLAASPQTAG